MCYQTNQQFGISDLTGVDLAVLYGGFDLNVGYSLMVDFGYDAPNLSLFVVNQNYTYLVYNSANSVPQIMIKYRTDFFFDLAYNDTSSNSTWNFGAFLIPYWNAHYSNGELPIVKYFKALPLAFDIFTNGQGNSFAALIEDKLITYWSVGLTTHHYLLFDSGTLEFTNSYTLNFSSGLLFASIFLQTNIELILSLKWALGSMQMTRKHK